MKKGPEALEFKTLESTKTDEKESKSAEKLMPSKKTLEERGLAQKTINELKAKEKVASDKEQRNIEHQLGEDFLREDFLARAEVIPKIFRGVQVEVGGEKYTLNFTCYQKDGKPVEKEKQKEFLADVKGKKVGMERIYGQFDLAGIEGRPEKLNLSYSLPLNRILTCQTAAMLKGLITGAFAGTDGYYRNLSARKQKEAAPVITPKQKPETADKKEAQVDKIRRAAGGAGMEYSILEGKEFVSIILRTTDKTQLHLTSADMAVWSVARVDNGKLTGKTTTENPLEFIKPQEAEAGL
jgi:hypothetical protein